MMICCCWMYVCACKWMVCVLDDIMCACFQCMDVYDESEKTRCSWRWIEKPTRNVFTTHCSSSGLLTYTLYPFESAIPSSITNHPPTYQGILAEWKADATFDRVAQEGTIILVQCLSCTCHIIEFDKAHGATIQLWLETETTKTGGLNKHGS